MPRFPGTSLKGWQVVRPPQQERPSAVPLLMTPKDIGDANQRNDSGNSGSGGGRQLEEKDNSCEYDGAEKACADQGVAGFNRGLISFGLAPASRCHAQRIALRQLEGQTAGEAGQRGDVLPGEPG